MRPLLALLALAALAFAAPDADVAALRGKLQARQGLERDLAISTDDVCHPVQGMTQTECTQLAARLNNPSSKCFGLGLATYVQQRTTYAHWTGPMVVWAGSGCTEPCAQKAQILKIPAAKYCASVKSPVYSGDGGCQWDFFYGSYALDANIKTNPGYNPNLPSSYAGCVNVICENVCKGYQTCPTSDKASCFEYCDWNLDNPNGAKCDVAN